MIEPRFKQDPRETWWIERARCIGEDPELFFPVGTTGPAIAQTARAIEVCAGCPVRAECLDVGARHLPGRGRVGWPRRGGPSRDPTGTATRGRCRDQTDPIRSDDELIGVG